jgi:hypothetical protein
MPKLDIGVGEEFPLEEKPRGEDCARRAHHHHHFGHCFSRRRSPREDGEKRPEPNKTDKE